MRPQVTPRTSIKSFVVLSVLVSFSIGASQLAFSLLDVSETVPERPVASVEWLSIGDNPLVCNDAMDLPGVAFEDVRLSCSDVVGYTSTKDLWMDVASIRLSEEIQQRNIPNTVVDLEYIDFFAGADLGNIRYAAFRLLKQEGLLELTPRMVRDEIEYLYPDLPLNIQSTTGERLLYTKAAVIDWKTEVLQQEYFSERLEQQLMRSLEPQTGYQNNPLRQNGGFVFKVNPTLQDAGWLRIGFTVNIPSCPIISDVQSVYISPDKIVLFTFPLWQWGDHPDCLEMLESARFDAIAHLSIEYRSEMEWNERALWVVDREREECSIIDEAMNVECFNYR